MREIILNCFFVQLVLFLCGFRVRLGNVKYVAEFGVVFVEKSENGIACWS